RIATVGAPHGLSGQVRLRLHTDNPQGRLARGVQLSTEPPQAGPLTIAMVRHAQDEWYAKFEGVTDRTAAEGLRGLLLLAAEDTGEPDAWYPGNCVGCAPRTGTGRRSASSRTCSTSRPRMLWCCAKRTAGARSSRSFSRSCPRCTSRTGWCSTRRPACSP